MRESTGQESLWKVGFGAIGESLRCLERAGITDEHLKRLRSDNSYCRKVSLAMLNGLPIHWEVARQIMGMHFFGPKEWEQHFGVNVSENGIPLFPWDEWVLGLPCPFTTGIVSKQVKDSHFAFLGIDNIGGVPLDIHKWYEITKEPEWEIGLERVLFYDGMDGIWQLLGGVAPQTCSFRWYLMSIEPPYVGETYWQQKKVTINSGYEKVVPIVEITKLILHDILAGGYGRRVSGRTQLGDKVISIGYCPFNTMGVNRKIHIVPIENDELCKKAHTQGIAASRKM